jgi:broad specificity phosphatase PhoE
MTEYQQLIVIRHGESLTNATNTFRAANQYDTDRLTPMGADP